MPEERVQKNGDAIIAGDFTFELEGNWLQKFFKGFFKKKYEDTACEMMAMHYAFYEELNKVGSVKEEEYVTREATICCSNGTEMVQLDAYEDHGILAANEKPLMTCSDCEVNKNIYSFGTCKCGNIYSEELPHPGPRRYESYKESIVDHSDILLDERYAEAWEYKDNPFIYVSIIGSIIGSIYATGSDYGDTAASIMHDYFMWDDEEKDWEEYILWREGK